MLELGILMAFVVGALWLFGALLGGLFKLTFGLFGMLIGGVFGIFGLAIAVLVALPILFLVLLPLMLPALCVVALVWLIVRTSRPVHPAHTPN